MAGETKTWGCSICGNRYEGEEPPGVCPGSGATKDKFVEL